jgi:hypothetical protein
VNEKAGIVETEYWDQFSVHSKNWSAKVLLLARMCTNGDSTAKSATFSTKVNKWGQHFRSAVPIRAKSSTFCTSVRVLSGDWTAKQSITDLAGLSAILGLGHNSKPGHWFVTEIPSSCKFNKRRARTWSVVAEWLGCRTLNQSCGFESRRRNGVVSFSLVLNYLHYTHVNLVLTRRPWKMRSIYGLWRYILYIVTRYICLKGLARFLSLEIWVSSESVCQKGRHHSYDGLLRATTWTPCWGQNVVTFIHETSTGSSYM